MTSSTLDPAGWLLSITIDSAPAEPAQWEKQLQLLRSVAGFDQANKLWRVRIGALDLHALQIPQLLLEAARDFGARIYLEAAPAPMTWAGPSFRPDDGDLASLLAARADASRALGILPTA
ncbi:hypothetical protein P8605_04700 [Streptomyces sp. T-3]|nr:hypothetical protein [Streptomyces sp. T-3]